jgi:hypothetical protein
MVNIGMRLILLSHGLIGGVRPLSVKGGPRELGPSPIILARAGSGYLAWSGSLGGGPAKGPKGAFLQKVIVRFLSQFLGSRVVLCLNPSMPTVLVTPERLYGCVLAYRLQVDQEARSMGYVQACRFRGLVSVLLSAARYKDPDALLSWLRSRMEHMSLFRHRRFLSFVAVALRYVFEEVGGRFCFSGVTLRVRGKLSVAGNARRRAFLFGAGKSSFTSLKLHMLQQFGIVRTTTGCLGVWVRFFL